MPDGGRVEPWATLVDAFDAEERQADAIKVAVCEYLLAVNAENPGCQLIPRTAIDWLGNGLTRAVLHVVRDAS